MAVPYLGLLFGSHPPCTHTADWSAVQRIIEAQLSRDPMITLLLAFNTPHFSFPSSSRARHHETTRAQAHAPSPDSGTPPRSETGTTDLAWKRAKRAEEQARARWFGTEASGCSFSFFLYPHPPSPCRAPIRQLGTDLFFQAPRATTGLIRSSFGSGRTQSRRALSIS
jgi:hypothetical protein